MSMLRVGPGALAGAAGMRERGGKVKMVRVPNVKADTLYKAIQQNIASGAEMVVTDEYPTYPHAMGSEFRAKHQTICHKRQFIAGDLHTNNVESAFSLLKRGIIGSYHRVSLKHLTRYLNEFTYRFNRRKDPNIFSEVVERMVSVRGLTYKALVAEPDDKAPATA